MYIYRKSGKFRVDNFSCCIFLHGEIFVIVLTKFLHYRNYRVFNFRFFCV